MNQVDQASTTIRWATWQCQICGRTFITNDVPVDSYPPMPPRECFHGGVPVPMEPLTEFAKELDAAAVKTMATS